MESIDLDKRIFTSKLGIINDREKELILTTLIRINNIVDNIFWEEYDTTKIYKSIKLQLENLMHLIKESHS